MGWFDCDCACAQPPDYSGVAAANEAAARYARETAQEDLAFRKQVYQDSLPHQAALRQLAYDVAGQQMGIAGANEARAADQWRYYQQQYQPQEQMMSADAMAGQYLSPEQRQQMFSIMNDPNLSPQERSQQLSQLSAAGEQAGVQRIISDAEAMRGDITQRAGEYEDISNRRAGDVESAYGMRGDEYARAMGMRGDEYAQAMGMRGDEYAQAMGMRGDEYARAMGMRGDEYAQAMAGRADTVRDYWNQEATGYYDREAARAADDELRARQSTDAQINSSYGQQARNLARRGFSATQIADAAANLASQQALTRVGSANQMYALSADRLRGAEDVSTGMRQTGAEQGRQIQFGGEDVGRQMRYEGQDTGGQMRYEGQDTGRQMRYEGRDTGRQMAYEGQDTGRQMQYQGQDMARGMREAGQNQALQMRYGAEDQARALIQGAPEAMNNKYAALRAGSAGFGRNMPNTAAQAYGLASGAATAGLGAQQSGFQSGLPYAQFVGQATPYGMQAANVGMQGALGMGNIMSRDYGTAQGAYNAQTAAGWGNMGEIAGTAMGFLASSDRRLKKHVRKLGELANGIGVYLFEYIWGGGPKVGVMADEVLDVIPEAVVVDGSGYMMVDYSKLGA